MREVIVKEWRDDIGMIHQEEVGELVRCKDCIHQLGERPRVYGFVYCHYYHKMKSEKAYCSYGERIEG